MGFFGSYIFDGHVWDESNPEAGAPVLAEPWLSVLIHDSDFAAVSYRPPGAGAGLTYVGVTPRVYFDDESASAETDPDAESVGLAELLLLTRNAAATDTAMLASQIRPFLAADDDPETDSDDDADIFAEIKVARLLRSLGVPLPAELAEVHDSH